MFNLDIYPTLPCFILKIKPVILYYVKKALQSKQLNIAIFM